jgi:hypothetical protein
VDTPFHIVTSPSRRLAEAASLVANATDSASGIRAELFQIEPRASRRNATGWLETKGLEHPRDGASMTAQSARSARTKRGTR